MIVCNGFLGDNNDALMAMQHNIYFANVAAIFEHARQALTTADAVIGSELLIVQKAQDFEKFDHRILQDAHDILAMSFRFKKDDGGQLKLSETQTEQLSRYQNDWSNWLNEQLSLLSKNPQFVRSVVEAVVFANSELGFMAEKRICRLLLSFFDAKDWSYENGYIAVYGRLEV